jgi:hypothetical protein
VVEQGDSVLDVLLMYRGKRRSVKDGSKWLD